MFENLRSGLRISDYKRIRINLRTAYLWGRGWTDKESKAFETEVYNRLRAEGFEVKESGDSFSCPKITVHKFGEKMDLYLHPMEVTGFATIEQAEKVYSILKECKTIEAVGKLLAEDVFDLPDSKYEELIYQNAEDILEMVRGYIGRFGERPYDYGFFFAEHFRIPRDCSYDCGRSSSDIDVKAVNNMALTFKSLGLI